MTDIRKIYIAGGAGVGKTRLSKILADATGYPVFELDFLLWTEDSTDGRIPNDDRAAILHDIAIRPSWIADGSYVGWAQELWRDADLVVFLDIGLRLMLWRIFWRHVKAELRRNNRHPGWRTLIKFMRYVRHSYNSTETGNIDDHDESILTQAKIRAKALQQQHKVLKFGANPDIDQILGLINSK